MLAQTGAGPSVTSAGGFVFADNFNRSNENLEASSNWTRIGGAAGAAAVVSNQLNDASATETPYSCPNIGSTNHYAQAVWARGSANVSFIGARVVDANNYVGVRYSGGALQLYKKVSGSFTLLGSYSYTVASTDVLRVEASGDNVRALVNGVERVAPTSLGGSLGSSTLCGVIARSTAGAWIDTFEAGTL